ncbi:MAG: cupin domain-containing protein [Elusimicrobiota bacterium]
MKIELERLRICAYKKNNTSMSKLIKLYDLEPHPEGGYFKETYRAKGKVSQRELPSHFKGTRNYSTAIYFLLPEGKRSNLHRIQSDEIWHFYLGGPLTLIQIPPSGQIEKVVLGQDVETGQKLQHIVPAGCWFGAHPNPGSAFSFVGCTVSPGFDFADFEMGKRADLTARFPRLAAQIRRFTRE